jgi:hypothetical protein
MSRHRHECELYDDEGLVGYMLLLQHHESTVQLCEFWTSQAGVGHRMFDTVCDYLCDTGYTDIVVATDQHDLYRKLGFSQCPSSSVLRASIENVLCCCRKLAPITLDAICFREPPQTQ